VDGGEVSGGRWALAGLVPFVIVGALAAISALDASQPVQLIGALAVLALGIVTETKILKGRKRDS
jgi:hypothetical protein